MNLLRVLKKLLLGETWLLPFGVAAAVILSLALRALLGDAWNHAGGFIVLAAVTAALMLSVVASARPR